MPYKGQQFTQAILQKESLISPRTCDTFALYAEVSIELALWGLSGTSLSNGTRVINEEVYHVTTAIKSNMTGPAIQPRFRKTLGSNSMPGPVPSMSATKQPVRERTLGKPAATSGSSDCVSG